MKTHKTRTPGQKLKKFMQVFLLTQQEIAEKLNITRGALSHYINGRNEIPKIFAMALQLEYGLNPNWLYNDQGRMIVDEFIIKNHKFNKKYTYKKLKFRIDGPISLMYGASIHKVIQKAVSLGLSIECGDYDEINYVVLGSNGVISFGECIEHYDTVLSEYYEVLYHKWMEYDVSDIITGCESNNIVQGETDTQIDLAKELLKSLLSVQLPAGYKVTPNTIQADVNTAFMYAEEFMKQAQIKKVE